eukprot:6457491-Amphidinium_carterae.2
MAPKRCAYTSGGRLPYISWAPAVAAGSSDGSRPSLGTSACPESLIQRRTSRSPRRSQPASGRVVAPVMSPSTRGSRSSAIEVASNSASR